MTDFEFKNNKKIRWSLISWALVPILIVWLSTNYLIGQLHAPKWSIADGNGQVAGQSIVRGVVPSPQVEIPLYHWHGEGLVTLWFDDAWLSQYTFAYPILTEYKLKGALAVPTKLVGLDAYMSWAHIKKVQSIGWEITDHTRNHNCDMDKENDLYIDGEINGSLQDLRENGLEATNYVSPCGILSSRIMNDVKKTFVSFRTSEDGVNLLPLQNPYSLLVYKMVNTTTTNDVKKWLAEADTKHAWVIIVFHQIDNTHNQYSITPGLFKTVTQMISDSKIPVVLPTQVLGLVDESVK